MSASATADPSSRTETAASGVDQLDLVTGKWTAGRPFGGFARCVTRAVEHDDDLEPVGRKGLGRERAEARGQPVARAEGGHHDGEVTHPAKVATAWE
jgi:hypothetical protein